jgi:hypothetical protein
VQTFIALIALFLVGMQGRAALVARSIAASKDSATSALAGWMIFAAGLANMAWALLSWPWYWVVVVVVAMALISGAVVTIRTVERWLFLRPFVAVATAASAGLLWVAYSPAGWDR